jgi:hypothetical protein
MNILDMYKNSDLVPLESGTPDPNAYHDISAVDWVGSKMGGNHGYSGLRGVLIPKATREGASRGYNHMAPQKVFIDPQFTNKKLIVDVAKMQANPDAVMQAIAQNYGQYDELADAAIATFAEFCEPIEEAPDNVEIQTSYVPTPVKSQATQQAGGRQQYVAPKASAGGAQMRTKTASFNGLKPTAKTLQLAKQAEVQEEAPQQDHYEAPRTSRQEPISRAVTHARSLHSELMGGSSAPLNSRPMRKVVFELPVPGQPGANMGQFAVNYHDVIRQGEVLVLVYDHNLPTQMVWFPPLLEDPSTKEALAMPVLVEGVDGEPDFIYLAYPTGVQFIRNSEEYCILTVEQEKPLETKARR